MVVKMMRWPPWPPVSSRKFEVKVIVQRLEGLKMVEFDSEKRRLLVEIKWKGEKSIGLGNLRRSVKRNFTEEGGFCGDGVFEWNEEFLSLCNLSGYKDGLFYPWEIAFSVFAGLNQEPRNTALVGTVTLNLAEFASMAMEKQLELNLPLSLPSNTTESSPMLCLCLWLRELVGTVQEPPQAVPGSVNPVPSSPSSEEALSSPQKNELSGIRAGLRKVRIFGGIKKAFREEGSNGTKQRVLREDTESNSPFDTDSLDDDADADYELEESNEDSNSQLSVNYETLAYANFAGVSLTAVTDAEGEGWINYTNSKTDMAYFVGNATETVCDQSLKESSKRRILDWRKRKLRFRPSKPRVKGEPLLKKYYGETGGDDIDFDRRQLSSSDESSFGWSKSEEGSTTSRSSFSEFGDDHFAVGSWEKKEIICRDGQLKLQAEVFFASIDQMSERAAGESACTALVAVIANWLQSNQYEVPIKSEFDGLIRDGSLEWRNMCENEYYQQQFPDKHFDLETILQAKIRPLSVVAEKSFIGFFHPEGLEGDFDFLHGAMSFDGIWDEISRNASELSNNGDPLVYIVSWNDHFFVLKVESDAYYLIDTLGERLYEGCDQAYVLKFDKGALVHRLPMESTELDKKSSHERNLQRGVNMAGKMEAQVEEIVCKGKESCKEYIKSFLAAIPIRELQADMKKGLIASVPIHHRLQIEFHYTQLTQAAVEYSSNY